MASTCAATLLTLYWSAHCREAFVAPAGRVLLSADYAQMELRLMAHLSGDASLIATLSDPLQDPFTQWAAQWLRIPPPVVRQYNYPCLMARLPRCLLCCPQWAPSSSFATRKCMVSGLQLSNKEPS